MNVPQIKKANFMTPHQRHRALRSLELYLQGDSWVTIAKKGGFSWTIFSQYMMQFPDLSKAYSEARRQSGQAFEDKALDLAAELVAPNEFGGTQVRAHEVAMNQYRWSASRRDPAAYAEAGANKLSVIVPVQINSSLNLAQPGAVTEVVEASIWDIHRETLEGSVGTPSEGFEDVEEELAPKVAEGAPEQAPDPLEALADELGLPDELASSIKRRPSPGRPRKGHKSKRLTSVNRTNMIKRARKNPTVARALGLTTETTDELAVDVGLKSPVPARK